MKLNTHENIRKARNQAAKREAMYIKKKEPFKEAYYAGYRDALTRVYIEIGGSLK